MFGDELFDMLRRGFGFGLELFFGDGYSHLGEHRASKRM